MTDNNITKDMEEFEKNIKVINNKSRNVTFNYEGDIKLDSDVNSINNYPLNCILNNVSYKLGRIELYFIGTEGQHIIENIDLKKAKPKDIKNIKKKINKNLINKYEIFVVALFTQQRESNVTSTNLFYTFNPNKIDNDKATSILKKDYKESELIILPLKDANIFPEKENQNQEKSSSDGKPTNASDADASGEDKNVLSKINDKAFEIGHNIRSWASSLEEFIGGGLAGIQTASKKLWSKIKQTNNYRYKWVLFETLDDYRYCELLGRYPHANSVHQRPMKPSITVKKDGETSNFTFSKLFRGSSTPLETDKLITKNAEFEDTPRFSDLRTLQQELESKKILGLGVANAVEGNTFWSIVFNFIGIKGNKLKFDPNELYWKWTKIDENYLKENNIFISGKVVNVTDCENECEKAIGLGKANVFVYDAKISGNEVELIKKVAPDGTTHKDGTFYFNISKKDISGNLVVVAQKNGFKDTGKEVLKIKNRSTNSGTHLDIPCGSPNIVLPIKNKIEDVTVPLIKGEKKETNKAPFILLNDKNKKGVLLEAGIEKTDPRKEIIFNIDSDKRDIPAPEKFKLGLFCYNPDVREKASQFKWKLKYNNSLKGEYELNSFKDSEIHIDAIKKYKIDATDVKNALRDLIIDSSTEDKKYKLVAVLVNQDKYNEKEFLLELDLIAENYKDFLKKYKDNIERVIYDFQIVIIDNSITGEPATTQNEETGKSMDMKKELKKIKNTTESLEKK